MKLNVKYLMTMGLILAYATQVQAKTGLHYNTSTLYFIENKGQIRDQNNNPRSDIQYSLKSPGMNVFVGNGQLHYQFSKQDVHKEIASGNTPFTGNSWDKFKDRDVTTCSNISTYRVDVELVGANKVTEGLAEEKQAYYENYYVAGCPAEGIQAHTYKKITYKNVYNDIDWVIYINGGKMEHEFVVRPGGDASKIKLRYHGQTSLNINEDGSITATTPMGTINEHAPVCYRADGRKTPSSFKLRGNTLSYEVNGYYNSLVIDPVLEWGTYYGPDTSTSPFYAIVCDRSANIYGSGFTYAASEIATTGSFQEVFGGDQDAYLVKFDSSGNRIWATYYGNIGIDIGYAVSIDTSGNNIYIGGTTSSTTGIATPGAQQTTYGGGTRDCFVARFNNSGLRLWCTYLGGSGDNVPGSMACDYSGNVYIGGFTTDVTNTATPGSFQPAKSGGYDDFLVQYDSTGVRQWGTYYGGGGDEFAGAICSDGTHVYISGWTTSTTGIATALAQQPALGGSSDAFLAKFDASGNRIWGTYYGGPNAEGTGGVTCDNQGYIYLLGTTGSDAGIASAGCFQPARGGATDAFLAKFEPELGLLQWGTYYGGPDVETDNYSRITTDDSNDVFITGYTASTSGIASTGAWQTVYGGADEDGFLAKYNSNGVQYWSTYYGGDGTDEPKACVYAAHSIFVCGNSNSDAGISTVGSFEATGSGAATFYYMGFLARFGDYLISGPGSIGGPSNLCIGYPVTMTNILPGGAWSSSNTGVATIGSSSGVVTPVSTGTSTITYATTSGTVTATVTVNTPPSPIIGVDSFCQGYSTTLSDVTPGGAWSSSNTSVATIGYSSGVLFGVSVGTTTITYTDTVTSCYASMFYTIKNCSASVSSVSNNDNIEIYPNPVADVLNINIHNGNYNSFIIVNETGQVMAQQQLSGAQSNVNVKSLPPGIYYITLNGDFGMDVRKFVKR